MMKMIKQDIKHKFWKTHNYLITYTLPLHSSSEKMVKWDIKHKLHKIHNYLITYILPLCYNIIKWISMFWVGSYMVLSLRQRVRSYFMFSQNWTNLSGLKVFSKTSYDKVFQKLTLFIFYGVDINITEHWVQDTSWLCFLFFLLGWLQIL